jgi:hypothetical protein
MTMLEKMCRAICASTVITAFNKAREVLDEDRLDRIVDKEWQNWRNAAVAALHVMREPSAGMLSSVDHLDTDKYVARGRAVEIWDHMIDAAKDGQ